VKVSREHRINLGYVLGAALLLLALQYWLARRRFAGEVR